MASPSKSGPATLKWGIVGAGKISNDHCEAMKCTSGNEIVAVAARDLDRAREFADRFHIPQAYGSYSELAQDPNIDVVYVGTTNNTHFEVVKLMLEHNKHVLCEKPMVPTVAEIKELIGIAQRKQKFLMEALWSRCFPVYKQVQDELRLGVIGKPTYLQAQFIVGLVASDRVVQKETYGGAVYDIGCYLLQVALWVFGTAPTKVQAIGMKNEHGMPMECAINLQFPENASAQLLMGSQFNGKTNEVTINGTDGYIRINHPFHAPTDADINGSKVHYDLPITDGKYCFHNSAGLAYQAQRVADCIREGRIESPEVPHDTSLLLAQLTEDIHKQLGVTFGASSSAAHTLLDTLKHKIMPSSE